MSATSPERFWFSARDKGCVVSKYNELWAMFLWISWNVETRRSKFICVQECKDECPFLSFITEARWRILWDTTFKLKLIYYVGSTSRFKQGECVYFYTYTYTINIDSLYFTLKWGITSCKHVEGIAYDILSVLFTKKILIKPYWIFYRNLHMTIIAFMCVYPLLSRRLAVLVICIYIKSPKHRLVVCLTDAEHIDKETISISIEFDPELVIYW